MEHKRICPPPSNGTRLTSHTCDIRERLPSALHIVDQLTSIPASRHPDQPVTLKDVRAMLKLRRKRDEFFAGELFADPAWDILMELYAAALGQQKISVGNVCLGAAVPSTTALRWITLLENKKLIERRADPMDRRRFYLVLSSDGLAAMDNYFKTVPDGTPLI